MVRPIGRTVQGTGPHLERSEIGFASRWSPSAICVGGAASDIGMKAARRMRALLTSNGLHRWRWGQATCLTWPPLALAGTPIARPTRITCGSSPSGRVCFNWEAVGWQSKSQHVGFRIVRRRTASSNFLGIFPGHFLGISPGLFPHQPTGLGLTGLGCLHHRRKLMPSDIRQARPKLYH